MIVLEGQSYTELDVTSCEIKEKKKIKGKIIL